VSYNNKDLFDHLKLCHGVQKKYTCAAKECGRTDGLYRSFRRHVRKCHPDDPSAYLHDNVNDSNELPLQESLDQIQSDDELPLEEVLITCSDNFFEVDETGSPHSHFSCPNTALMNDEILHSENFTKFFNNPAKCDISLKDLLSTDATKAAAYLYSVPNLPRNHVEKVIEIFSSITNETAFSNFENRVLNRLDELGDSQEDITNFEDLFEVLKNPFKGLNTEHKLTQQFQKRGTLIESKPVTIGSCTKYKREGGVLKAKPVPCTTQFVPARAVLKKFFELPSVYARTMNFIRRLQSEDDISNIIQAEFWRNSNINTANESHPIFPISIYFDDFENNNPLESHKGIAKCGAVYFIIPVLPIEMQAKVENIFLFQLFRSMDKYTCSL